MRSNEIHPGDLVAGKYRVRAILGRSHGLLVDAFHTEFEQRVVIKILQPSQCDEHEVERFRREARTLAKLESEHVARIIDVGGTQDGSFYLVRQHLEGIDLAAYLKKKRGPLQLPEAVLYILQAAEATAETHGHNVIIRELEPSHLFLTQRSGGAPLIKIIDFGTAKLMRESAAPSAGDLTATAMFGLSPYSSPELMRKAKNVDVRTDVWSLGAILYELLTGRPPFSGDSAFLMLQISKEEPVPVTHLRPDLPPEIDQIIGWCLAKDVDARFRNIHAFAHALSPYTSAEGQVLIQRIGQTTEAAKKRKAAARDAPAVASQPVAVRIPPARSSVSGNEDSATKLISPAMAERVGVPSGAPVRGTDPASFTQPFPRDAGSQPGFSGPPAPASFSGAPAPASAPQSQPLAGIASTAQSMTLPDQQAHAPQRNRKVVIGLMAVAAVLVPVLVAVLFLSGGKKDGAVESDSTAPIAVPIPSTPSSVAAAPSDSAVVAVAPDPSAAPSAAPDPSAQAAAPEPPVTSAPVAAVGGAPIKKGGKVPPAPTPTPPPVTPPPSSGAKGTLVAVAMGGSCAFSVNGSSKGTSSSLRVALNPGKYSVTCKPSTGSAKSKSIVVKSGETAMATFRL